MIEVELDRGEVLPVIELLPGELLLPGLECDPGRRQASGSAGKKERAANNLKVLMVKIC